MADSLRRATSRSAKLVAHQDPPADPEAPFRHCRSVSAGPLLEKRIRWQHVGSSAAMPPIETSGMIRADGTLDPIAHDAGLAGLGEGPRLLTLRSRNRDGH